MAAEDTTVTPRRLQLTAPLDGIVVPLTEVADPVFSQGTMGPGIAIEPLSSILCAPCAATVVHLAKTNHALTLCSDDGVTILLHVGIDTVKLDGDGFTAHVQQGERIRCGQPLIEFDADRVSERVPSLQVMVVATDDNAMTAGEASGRLHAGSTSLLEVLVAATATATSSASAHKASRSVVVGHQAGLHARPAALVQKAARSFRAQVTVRFGERDANARGIVALMALGVAEGELVNVIAEGADADQAAETIAAAISAFSASGQLAAPIATATVAGAPSGIIASPGIAVGTVVRWTQREVDLPRDGDGIGIELDRLALALQVARRGLADAIARADADGDTAARDIFAAHLALADDAELIAAAEQTTLNGRSAGFAFRQAAEAQCQNLRNTGNALLAERANDLLDIGLRVLQAMGYTIADAPLLVEDSILVVEDLTPAQFSQLDRDRLAGIATVFGGATSHVAIMARALGIPALVAAGQDLLSLLPGQQVVLDCQRGRIDRVSGQAMLDAARAAMATAAEERRDAARFAFEPANTRDEITIEVAANVGSLSEAQEALKHGADAVGLLRTELLFMDRTQLPTQAEQQALYGTVLKVFGNRPVTIRTLDIGGDKEAPYLRLPAEANPALGLRGIRLALARPDVVADQLQALLAASTEGRLRLLLPMVADLADLRSMRALLQQAAARAGVATMPEIGIMIEVPSAALLADRLAAEADFLSIGTNDLSQYALAVDRGHPTLSSRLDPLHPALLRLIATTASGAAHCGKWVGVCGGMAADLDAIPILLGLGVTELSVSPGMVPMVKSRIRALSVSECILRADDYLQLDSAAAVRELAARTWPRTT